MKSSLSEQEQARVVELNNYIQAGLAGGVKSHLVLAMCGSCRLTNLRFMREMLEIHGYYVVDQEATIEN